MLCARSVLASRLGLTRSSSELGARPATTARGLDHVHSISRESPELGRAQRASRYSLQLLRLIRRLSAPVRARSLTEASRRVATTQIVGSDRRVWLNTLAMRFGRRDQRALSPHQLRGRRWR